jgi:hypothetical protein
MPQRLESSSSADAVPRPGMIYFFLSLERNIFYTDITKACDYVLWAGDMNFRIDMTHEEVLEYNTEKKFHELLLKDEFHIGQKKGGK